MFFNSFALSGRLKIGLFSTPHILAKANFTNGHFHPWKSNIQARKMIQFLRGYAQGIYVFDQLLLVATHPPPGPGGISPPESGRICMPHPGHRLTAGKRGEQSGFDEMTARLRLFTRCRLILTTARCVNFRSVKRFRPKNPMDAKKLIDGRSKSWPACMKFSSVNHTTQKILPGSFSTSSILQLLLYNNDATKNTMQIQPYLFIS